MPTATEKKFQEAVKALELALPIHVRNDGVRMSVPVFDDSSAVEANADALLVSIDEFLENIQRDYSDSGGKEIIRDYMQKWFTASYPFVKFFLFVAEKTTGAVYSPKICQFLT